MIFFNGIEIKPHYIYNIVLSKAIRAENILTLRNFIPELFIIGSHPMEGLILPNLGNPRIYFDSKSVR